MELKKCPCGKVPIELGIDGDGRAEKWAYVHGSCCSEWNIEFRTGYREIGSEGIMEVAIKAWNSAPRK